MSVSEEVTERKACPYALAALMMDLLIDESCAALPSSPLTSPTARSWLMMGGKRIEVNNGILNVKSPNKIRSHRIE